MRRMSCESLAKPIKSRPLRAARTWCGAVIMTLVLAYPAPAQTTLPAQPELARLVDLSAERLKLRISYDEALVKGRVTLRSSAPYSDDELWKLTNRLLAEQSLATVVIGDDQTMSIVKFASAAQLARLERIELATVTASADAATEDLQDQIANRADPSPRVLPGFRRLLVPLRHTSTRDAAQAVAPLLSKGPQGGGTVIESEQAGFIIIADYVPYLNNALRVLHQLDGTDAGLSIREIAPRNLEPARLASVAKQLLEKRKAAGGRELRGDLVPGAGNTGLLLVAPASSMEQWLEIIAAADQREPVERRTYSPGPYAMADVAKLIDQTVREGGAASTPSGANAAVSDQFRIIQDTLTGTLIITATTGQHEEIAELLGRMASVPAESRRPVRTFVIRNRAVRDVQQVIESLLRSGALDASPEPDAVTASPGPLAAAAPAQGPQTSARNFAPGGGTPPPVSPPSRPGLSSVIPPVASPGPVSGSGSLLTMTSDEATNTLIAVGEPRILAEVARLLPALDVRQPQVMLEAMLVSLSDSQSLNLGVELEKLIINGDTRIRLSSLFGLSTSTGSGDSQTRAVGDAAGGTGVVLSPGDFSVVVRALQTINHGRSLSNPKVLVNNNQQASFNSVLQQPFSSTNASNTVSTTSFGGTQDAGTTISVRPQIAEGDHLVLTYSISLSSFVGAAANANLPPPRQQNSIQSVATIPDGFTVVVGGLELTTSGEGVSQIPLLGSIPIVGEVFKNRSDNQGRQRFYVFLRASVLRHPHLEDLKYVSDLNSAHLSIPTGWPEVEPRRIGGGKDSTGSAHP